MAKCGFCETTIVFGGVKDGHRRYCNGVCRQTALTRVVQDRMSDAEISQHVQRSFAGPCPKCKGPGPVNLHVCYSALSLIILTKWESVPIVSCRQCARKKQSFYLAVTTLCGWWGIPFGPFVTLAQIYRNIAALAAPDSASPSPAFVDWVCEDLGRRRLLEQG